TVVDFAIVAFALFLVIKAMNRLRAPAAAPPAPAVPEDVKLLTEIRDLLKK
nr:MscL family protein [Acidobacteriota bacterium]